MALPLPQVVADVGPGGPLVTSMRGMNALRDDLYGSQVKRAQAQYAPYTTYADAASKLAYANMLPYQILSQTMSNPMIWQAIKDSPEAQNTLMNNLRQSMPDPKNIFGGMNMPTPDQMGNQSVNPLRAIANWISGKGAPSAQPSYPMQNMGGQSADLPGGFGVQNIATPQEVNDQMDRVNAQRDQEGFQLSPGGTPGIVASKTAAFNQQPYKPGATIASDQGAISVPSGETVTSLQTSINAAKRVTPQIERLADQAAPFMTVGGKGKMALQGVGNVLGVKKLGGDLPSKYAEFQSNIQAVPESLVKTYGLHPTNETIERMQKVIEPMFGETKEGYKQRVLSNLEYLRQEQIQLANEQLTGGIPLNEKPKRQQGMITLEGGLVVPPAESFKGNPQGFNDWWAAQPAPTKKAYRKYLEGLK